MGKPSLLFAALDQNHCSESRERSLLPESFDCSPQHRRQDARETQDTDRATGTQTPGLRGLLMSINPRHAKNTRKKRPAARKAEQTRFPARAGAELARNISRQRRIQLINHAGRGVAVVAAAACPVPDALLSPPFPSPGCEVAAASRSVAQRRLISRRPR